MLSEVKQLNFPSHFASFETKKGKKWCGQFAKAFYHQFLNSGINLFYNRAEQYKINRTYAIGRQNVDIYKRHLRLDDKNQLFVNLIWKVPPVLPKFRNIVLAKMEQQQYRLTASAIDPLALNEKRAYRNDLLARIRLQRQLVEQSMEAGIPMEEPQLQSTYGEAPMVEPKTPEEVEMHMEIDYKHRVETLMEQGLDLVFYLNDWKEIRKELHKDMFDCGVACARDYIDSNGFIRIKRVDPSTVFVGQFFRQDMKDVRKAGEYYEMTVQELRQQAGQQFTEAQLADMASIASGRYYEPVLMASGVIAQEYDDVRLRIFTCEWSSADVFTTEERTNHYGNVTKEIKPFGWEEPKGNRYKGKVTRKTVKTWYTCSWIVGTDYVFDYGLAHDMKRPNDNLADAIGSYHFYAVNLANGDNQSAAESVMAYVDNIASHYFKLQHLVAEARPAGLAIEVDSLEDVIEGKGGEMMRPLEVMEITHQRGDVLYRRRGEDGEYKNGNPIQELRGGLVADVFKMVDLINFNMEMIRQTIGLNDVTDASSPSAGQLVGTSEVAVQATNNALYHLFSADASLFESIGKSVALRFQDVVTNYTEREWFIEALGTEAWYFMQANADVSLHTLGIKLEALPGDQDIAMVERWIEMSLNTRLQNGQGGIELEDAMAIRRVLKTSSKKAEQYLNFRRRKRKEADIAEAQANSEHTAAIQNQVAEQTALLEEQKAVSQHNRDLEKMREEYRLKMEFEQQRHQNTMAEKTLDGRIKEGHIITKGEVDEELLREEAEVFDARGDAMFANMEDNRDKAEQKQAA